MKSSLFLLLLVGFVACTQSDQTLSQSTSATDWNYVSKVKPDGTYPAEILPGQRPALDKALLKDINIYSATQRVPKVYTKIAYQKLFLHSKEDVMSYIAETDDGKSITVPIRLKRVDGNLFIDIDQTEEARINRKKSNAGQLSFNYYAPKCVMRTCGPCSLNGGQSDGYWECVCVGGGDGMCGLIPE